MRDFDEMKLARVIDACGGVDGRVKMQKIVYLLKVMGYELPFDDFVIRQLGPFSRAVACSTDLLKSAGFIDETREEAGHNVHGEPVFRYSYTVSTSIRPLLMQHFDVDTPPGKPPINDMAVDLKAQDRAVLEVAATKLYLQREDQLAGQALEDELRRLKGHLAADFSKADALLSEWKQNAWL